MTHSLTPYYLVLLIACLTALVGCGQKGDLYLPNIPPAPLVLESSAELSEANGASTADSEIKPKADKKRSGKVTQPVIAPQ